MDWDDSRRSTAPKPWRRKASALNVLGSFTAEAVKSRHRVQPERTHAPCWGGVGLRAASAPERAAPRSGHLALSHHKIASILRASGGRSSRARLMILLMFARRISTPPCCGASQSKTCGRGARLADL